MRNRQPEERGHDCSGDRGKWDVGHQRWVKDEWMQGNANQNHKEIRLPTH